MATLSIHFTIEDLARTRVADSPDAMWEIALSVQQLQTRADTAVFGSWRARARRRLGNWATPLTILMPDAHSFPDFLTPTRGVSEVDVGVSTVLSTPRHQLRSELAMLESPGRHPSWVSGLARGDSGCLTQLGAILRRYHREAIAPDWPMITATVRADRAGRARTLSTGGLEALIEGFEPLLRWRPPVLECAVSQDRDVHLDGRGLVLVPSFFCWPRPWTILHGPHPCLVYPIAHAEPVAAHDWDPDNRQQHLAALVGHTRAAILQSLETGCTTTELANRAGVSAGSASQHATVLRQAGLVSTRRVGGSVLHTLTDLGVTLLRQPPSV
jgi:DNA-binding transcriptional ArsR family regulator